MDLTEMIGLVRLDLMEVDAGNYRWSDDELIHCIQKAVVELSWHIPLEATADLPTERGAQEIDITGLGDRVSIDAVEYPLGLSPPVYQRFALWNGQVRLLGGIMPDGTDCRIYYRKVHILTDDGEDGLDSTIPSYLEGLVACGASGFAALAAGAYAVDRVNTGGISTAAESVEWGREQLDYFRRQIRRHGHNNRVRSGQLYAPYYPPVSKATDWGSG